MSTDSIREPGSGVEQAGALAQWESVPEQHHTCLAIPGVPTPRHVPSVHSLTAYDPLHFAEKSSIRPKEPELICATLSPRS